MQPRHRLDVGFADLGHGLLATLRARPTDCSAADRTVADLWRRTGATGLVTLSVRSAWDLLLTALAWPPGTEVLVSAITHPDMVTLLDAHGLCAVPVDVDPDTLVPNADTLEQSITSRTRGVLVAQLFGGRPDLGPVSEVARRHGLLLVVDAAQAFVGPDHLEQEHGDVWLYSFGLIKTASAVGGALVVSRDQRVLDLMADGHRSWPVQSRGDYAARLLRTAVLLVFSQPAVHGAFFALCARVGRDPDVVINARTRSFAGGASDVDALLARLRRRPAPALVALLSRRLRTFDPARLRARRRVGDQVAAALPPSVVHLGGGQGARTHWLVPVVVADPHRLVAALRRAGLDASRGTSNLTAVVVPDRSVPARAAALMDAVVYLPVYPELPEPQVTALLAAVHGEAAESLPDSPPPRWILRQAIRQDGE